ncbi:MAG: hypothetical protein JNN11_03460 [Candidatus Doudnabacteria bacterium]|nr:hypothetical protein [Candidatus Doudnabacteria bacterium]
MQKKKFKSISSNESQQEKFFSFLHELGNSLTVLKGNCQLILQNTKISLVQKQRLKSIDQEIKKIERSIKKYI